jgi:predicted esterase
MQPSSRRAAAIDQNGERRWFRKLSPTSFDQNDIHIEAAAFAGFMDGLRRGGKIGTTENTLVVGYSNGGNLASSVMLLHPGRIQHLVLLRCMPVLKRAPMTDLSGRRALVVAGSEDQTYGPYAGKLANLLRRRGASRCPENRRRRTSVRRAGRFRLSGPGSVAEKKRLFGRHERRYRAA